MFISKKDEEAKEDTPEEVDLADVDSFLDKKNDEIEKLLNTKKDVFLKEILLSLEKLEEDTQKLDSVDLGKIRSDERLIRVTKQGREDYIISLKSFMKNLRGLVSGDEKYEIGKITEKLDEFSKNSFSSYNKTTVLIGKEMEKIKDDVIRIRKSEDFFMKSNAGVIEKKKKIKDLIRRSDEKKENEKLKEDLSKQMEEIKGDREKVELELKSVIEKISEIERSDEYQEREKLSLEKEKKEVSLKEVESTVKSLFERRILEKYVHLNKEDIYAKIVQEYLADSGKALLNDKEVEIYKVLNYIAEKVRSNELKIKEADKVLEKISIGKDVFLRYRNSLLDLKEGIKKLDENISGIEIDFGDLLNHKSKVENKIEDNKSRFGALNKKGEKLDKTISELDVELKEGVAGFNYREF